MPSTSELNARNVAIVIFDDVQVLDFTGPFEVFSTASVEIPKAPYAATFTYTIGLTAATIMTSGGLAVTPRFSFDNCPQPDVLLIPGGEGSRRLLKHPRLLSWLAAQAEQVEVIASVCTGALALAAAGILVDKRATTHHDAFERLAAIEPTANVVRDQRFVRDGKIWTSGGISAGIDMSLAIVAELIGDTSPVVDEMEWHWHSSDA